MAEGYRVKLEWYDLNTEKRGTRTLTLPVSPVTGMSIATSQGELFFVDSVKLVSKRSKGRHTGFRVVCEVRRITT